MNDLSPSNPQRNHPELTNGSTPPRPLGSDDLIALFVAFVSIGSILFWALGQQSVPEGLTTRPPLTRTLPSPIAPLSSEATSANPILSLPVPQVIPSPQPFIPASPPSISSPQLSFSDVPQDFWASAFIAALAQRNIISGYPDNTFRPEQPVTRAEFAAMVEKAFPSGSSTPSLGFTDLPKNYWGTTAIGQAIQSGFMRGYPNNQFRPDQSIPKEQVLVALTAGLKLPTPPSPQQAVSIYQDAKTISAYAVPAIAAATRANLVVNHPDSNALTPQLTTSRAEAAATVYQALVQRQQAFPIQSRFVVSGTR
jgi:hypothetical protein